MSQRNTGVTIEVSASRECETPSAQAACSVLDVLGRVSGKWSIAILLVTTQGPARFTELERQVRGISRRMLTLTLRNLERDGLLTRTVYPTVPPKVEYTATPMARELYASLVELAGWAERHVEAIDRARLDYDVALAAAGRDAT
ncbi:HxlR family transcriptional regulator [Kitasatospora sp. SolWspMP-SS2h]|uniref:winged helix-turn-helix transcriptional regulator n=1 Tax=Kitasatospora sp. SolWspMP-SS2h TaxID=1305729 RepID=UPI000DBAD925|nr:helix-turn-helix domain-containing protein [Kitasatospora sp. SolWspMP-SS2h]RAJ31770.1 HxlR family transcriptional regulator [Kitasatospora sp. SolWspMP-SS2h]